MIARTLSTESLARRCARRPRLTIAVWIAVIATAGVLVTTLLGGSLTTAQTLTNSSDWERGTQLIEERMSGPSGVTELVMVRSASLTVDDPAYRDFVAQLQGRLLGLGSDTVEQTLSYFVTNDESMVSPDRRSTIVPVVMAGALDAASANIAEVHEVIDEVQTASDFEVFIAGEATRSHDLREQSEQDVVRGEVLGVPIALAILVLVFGAIAAAVLPLVLAGVSIVVALGATALVGQVFDLSFFVTNMITMMGLAVGIDYSLFIVSRFREERARGRDTIDAIGVAGSTASRAVLVSGLTVVVALAGMLIVPVNVFQSLSAGAILVVLAAVVASLTLLPAILSLAGDRIDRFRIPFIHRMRAQARHEGEGRFWDRVTRPVMRRPVIGLALAATVMAAATIPLFQINTGTAGVSTLPEGFRSREGLLALEEEFTAGLLSPTRIVIDGAAASAEVQEGIGRLQARLADDADFGPVQVQVSPAGDLAVLSTPIAGDPVHERATDAIRRLKADFIPDAFAGVDAEVLVTGRTAASLEFLNVTAEYTPFVIAFVLGISFVLLTVVFRSLVVPVKAILMNMLSVGAAYGLIVLVSQMGFGAELIGFQQVDTVESWIPLFLFSMLFGLSMDYHVFMLSRIRERYDQTGDNARAVAFGLSSTAGIITGAAAIMVAVFAGFAAGELVMFQQLGLGLAAAVFLDATIVRSVLVPSTMRLLGARNWYLPRFLRWIPDVRVEGAQPPRPVPVPVPIDDGSVPEADPKLTRQR